VQNKKRTARKRPKSREETPKEGMRRNRAASIIILCDAQSSRPSYKFSPYPCAIYAQRCHGVFLN
jgi:hypothetical protein